MAKRKLTDLAQALVLVDNLTDTDRATLLDYLKGKQPARPKSTSVPSAGKRSPRKSSTDSSTASTEGGTENALAVGASGD